MKKIESQPAGTQNTQISLFLIKFNDLYNEIETHCDENGGKPSELMASIGFSQRNEDRDGIYHIKETPTQILECNLRSNIDTLYEKYQ
jgi:hypothetical protein